MSEPVPQSQAYRVTDRSLLYPHLMRLVVDPLLCLVPPSVSPNALTLLANGVSLATILVVVSPGPEKLRFVLAALGFLVYVVLDNMDGAQARRTGRASPFGEFLDHWLDTFNAGYLSVGFGVATGLPLRWLLPFLCMAVLAFCASVWEQGITGHLRLGRVNQIEASLSLAVVFLLSAAIGPTWATRVSWAGITPLSLFLVWQIVTFTSVVVSCCWRTRRRFAPLAGTAALLVGYAVWGLAGQVDTRWLLVAVVLTNVVTSGRILISRVLCEPMRVVDPVHGALVAAGALAATLLRPGASAEGWVAMVAVAYLALRLAADARHAVRALRHHLSREELLGRLLLVRGG